MPGGASRSFSRVSVLLIRSYPLINIIPCQNIYFARYSTITAVSDPSRVTVQLAPIQESELRRINELLNIPEIAAHFETIPPVSMDSTLVIWHYIQSGIVFLWGVHAEGRIVGGAGFYIQAPGTRLSHCATFFLYLEPVFQGRGIGRDIMQFLEDEAERRHLRRMECMVTETNLRAIRLYQQAGYVLEGVKKQAFLIDGQYQDLILMGKILKSPARKC